VWGDSRMGLDTAKSQVKFGLLSWKPGTLQRCDLRVVSIRWTLSKGFESKQWKIFTLFVIEDAWLLVVRGKKIECRPQYGFTGRGVTRLVSPCLALAAEPGTVEQIGAQSGKHPSHLN
jgi:hypothetical protein